MPAYPPASCLIPMAGAYRRPRSLACRARGAPCVLGLLDHEDHWGAAPLPSTPASSWETGAATFGFSAFNHGGAVVPSLTTRYMWAPIMAMIAPGTSSMWIA